MLMQWQLGNLTGRLRVTELPGPAAPGPLLGDLTAQDGPALLESTALHPEFGRYSILACRPLAVLELHDGQLHDGRGDVLTTGDQSVWTALKNAFSAVTINGPVETPYQPGWIGYVGYEVGRSIERLPGRAKRDTALPDLRLAFYDAVLVFDAVEANWTLVELLFDSPPAGAGEGGRALRGILKPLRETADPPPGPPEDADATHRPLPSRNRAKSNFTPDEYRRAVARCVEYIAAGDIFQVNLSQRFAIPNAPDSLDIYRSLRRRNPAWYSAYIRFAAGGKNCAVVSSSPELFLRCRGRKVITRPIKGTRPRVGDEGRDAKAASELLGSEKDNAELAMIIDLLRNDLGRVCKFGTVRVTDPVRLETHPTVFHLVGTVEGELRDEVGPAELLRATFPGGSITGAPKIRAMEIIDELEPAARGVYTGCVGIVGVGGSTEWNIAIRTIVCDGGRTFVQVGGGIVADSTPDGEYNETLHKARAMLEAIR